MSNTPETDHLENELGQAARMSHPILWAQSRKLERERNEWAERWADLSRACLKDICALERERDEAREELAEAKREAENLAKSIYRSEYSDNDTDWELLDSVAGVISQIDNMYAGVREQRDEAREERDKLKQLLAADSLKLGRF